jgi:hypothetical protein
MQYKLTVLMGGKMQRSTEMYIQWAASDSSQELGN